MQFIFQSTPLQTKWLHINPHVLKGQQPLQFTLEWLLLMAGTSFGSSWRCQFLQSLHPFDSHVLQALMVPSRKWFPTTSSSFSFRKQPPSSSTDSHLELLTLTRPYLYLPFWTHLVQFQNIESYIKQIQTIIIKYNLLDLLDNHHSQSHLCHFH